jgi:peptide/nickel transport system permease protein
MPAILPPSVLNGAARRCTTVGVDAGLRAYVLRRVGFAVLMLAGVSLILFTLMRLAPGGPEAVLIGGEFSPAAAAQIRERLGLDRSLPLQYATWAAAAVRGDLGRSFKTGDPVAALILDRIGPTLQLTGGALLLALVTAIPLGVLAAVRRGSVWDTLGSAVSLFGVSFPSFWLGIMLILLFSEVFRLLPPSGLSEYGREADPVSRLRHAILPTLTLGAIQMAAFMRFTRSSLLEALRQDYVRTARAKGLSSGLVVWRHALRNALIPVVTVVGLSLPTLVGGAVLTETVFAWPGIGRLAVGAVFERDYPVIMGVNMMVAGVVITANLLTDLAYCLIDPRISYK